MREAFSIMCVKEVVCILENVEVFATPPLAKKAEAAENSINSLLLASKILGSGIIKVKETPILSPRRSRYLENALGEKLFKSVFFSPQATWRPKS